jgi:hypothetical protein
MFWIEHALEALNKCSVHRVFIMVALVVNLELVEYYSLRRSAIGRYVGWRLSWVRFSGRVWVSFEEYMGFLSHN